MGTVQESLVLLARAEVLAAVGVVGAVAAMPAAGAV
jgi:hypothetical protein